MMMIIIMMMNYVTIGAVSTTCLRFLSGLNLGNSEVKIAYLYLFVFFFWGGGIH